MISWIQRTFQHHFRLVFAVVLAGTIISFVVTIGATPGIGRADRRAIKRDFFGHNLGSQSDMQQVMRDGQISAILQGGAADDERLRDYALERVAALALAAQLHLPPATPTEMKGFIENLPVFAGPDGKFDAARYDQFRSDPRQFVGADGDDVARVLSEDVRIDRIERLIDGPGYVLPGDVREEILQADTSWTLGVATVDYASFHPVIVPTDAELAKYYQQNAFRYKIPPRLEASYVEFPAARYLPQVSVTPAEVRAYYDAHAADYDADAPKPAAGSKAVLTADAKFAAVRAKVEGDLKMERAKQLAAKAASDFAYDLYENKVTLGSGLDQYLAAHNLALKPLAPFTQEAGPAELGGSADLGQAAFQLNPERYFSEAEPTPNGSVVLIRRGLEPERQPLLTEVRSKVAADYIEQERRQQFIALGRTLRDELLARLKAGEKFPQAVAAVAARAKVAMTGKVLPPFTLENRPADVDDTVLSTLGQLKQGEVSPMVATADHGYLVYAQEEKAPNVKADAAQAAKVRSELAQASSRGAAIMYFANRVSQELKRSEAAAEAE